MIQIPDSIITDEKEYKNKVEQYRKGEIEAGRFKPYRVAMGIYEQRDNDTYMIRSRIPGGIITLEQLKQISRLADQYAGGYIHFTTRQDIQFHKVTLENTVNIMEKLLETHVITRGTGGNTPRNVGCSPLSGVSVDDVFDVTGYAEAVTSYLLKDPTVLNLPRKYKIAFSNSLEDTGNARIADLGFIAKIHEGKKGFIVYGGGGLGGSPTASIKLSDFIEANEVLYYVQAMKELFEKEGNRLNKHKARIRYILHRLGEEKFKALFFELLAKVKQEKDIDLYVEEEKEEKEIGQEISITNPNVVRQKQKGLYSVYVHPQNGNLETKDINRITEYLDHLGYKTSIRLTNIQSFYIRDIKGEDVEELLSIIEGFTKKFPVEQSIACAGAATCKLGLCLSHNLLSAIVERFENVEETIKKQLPRIFISGCPNSCGQHQKGLIGFAGKAKRTDDGLVPMYTIFFGGTVAEEYARLGQTNGDIPARKIPDFLVKLSELKYQAGIEDFMEFLKEKEDAINKLIEGYGTIETINENPSLYYDFGKDEPFSLKGRGAGECSAGVLDVIQLDISNSQTSLQDYKKNNNSEDLYKSALSASRALLILRGVDSTKDREIFKQFTQHFIKTGYVKQEVQDLFDTLIDFKLGDVESLNSNVETVAYLVDKIKQLYESLNPQLEITLPKETDTKDTSIEQKETDNTPENDDIKIADLKGVKCPMNFVKAKIEITKIKSGEKLGIYLDDGEPINNVPKSIEGEGHKVLSIDDSFDGYNLLVIQKK